MKIKILKDEGHYTVATESEFGWKHWLPREGDAPFWCFVHALEGAKAERLKMLERQCDRSADGVVIDI